MAGIPGSQALFNQIFFIVLMSVLIQGAGMGPLAAALRLTKSNLGEITERKLATSVLEVSIPPQSNLVGKRLVDLDLPSGVLVVLVNRGSETFIPGGKTQLAAKDTLLITNAGEKDKGWRKLFLVEPDGGSAKEAPAGRRA